MVQIHVLLIHYSDHFLVSAYILGRTACNTLISGASGGITVMVLHYYLNKENIKNKFSLVMLCNGNLAGLVAVTGYNYKL